MDKMFSPLIRAIVFVLVFSVLAGAAQDNMGDFGWPAVKSEYKPWTYWWWLGSIVDKPNLTKLLEAYSEAGIGGVHVIPIYGVKGLEEKFVEYLSPEWMDLLGHTVKEARRVGMGVDMSTGTGWPFGGPNVSDDDATAVVIFQNYELESASRLGEVIRCREKKYAETSYLQTLMGFSDRGDIVELTSRVDAAGKLDWTAGAGKWKLYAVFEACSGFKVKRAAPGGEGNVVDPFSGAALARYLKRFDEAFAGRARCELPRAQYHDSYEYGARWTSDLFGEFEKRRGYDLRRFLPELNVEGDADTVARVKSDFRETVAELHLEEFIERWVRWAHERGFITRNQAHGAPGNLLDLYAAADIPETEIFGPSGFAIPGLRKDPHFDNALPDVLALKFASSAAHVAGRKLVSSESCTWLGEHFKVSLSQVKPEMDQLFIAGVNHAFYHGMAYSPPDEPWPGWLFYASTNFAPSNSFWRDFGELNAYIARCQSILQSGQPDNDILLYWPIHDLWYNNKERMLKGLSVHGIEGWLYPSRFYGLAKMMWARGYSFDYVSDRQLAKAKCSGNSIVTKGGEYKVVVVPHCRFMPARTLRKLMSLAEAGATIIFDKRLPSDVPGLGDIENRRKEFEKALPEILKLKSEHSTLVRTRIGKGEVLIGESLETMLEDCAVVREPVADQEIQFIRRTHPQGRHYFLTNLGDTALDGWVSLGIKATSALILDPRFSDRQGLAALRKGADGAEQVYLQLQPGESLVLRTFASKQISGRTWGYLRKAGEPEEITGTWKVTFIEGGPRLPSDFETHRLASWTELGDDEAKRFAGTARYSITFEKPRGGAEEWLLDLGRVAESARVTINGRYVGAVWSFPFEIAVGKGLREGTNKLEVEVTNLSANRIADLDRRKVDWKKFHDINFVNIRYRKFDASNWPPMDSGLLGPVKLVPAMVWGACEKR